MAYRFAKYPHCVGNTSFIPRQLIDDTKRLERSREWLEKDDLFNASKAMFGIPVPDTYHYHAMTSVTLAEVQRIIHLGGQNGLHAWYFMEDGSLVSYR